MQPFELWKIHEGDCLELLHELPAGNVDAIVTDPPWPGCAIDVGWLGVKWWKRVAVEMERVVGDKGKIIVIVNSETDPRLILPVFTLPFVHLNFLRFIPPRYRGNICNAGDVAYQFGYGFLPKGKRVLSQLCTNAASIGHRLPKVDFPCYRNPGHMKWIIRTQVGPGRLVCDPFSGSGTTGLACLTEGADFFGFEIDSEICRKANERLSAARDGLSDKDRARGQRTLLPESSKA